MTKRQNPLQLISEWKGMLNYHPCTVLLRVQRKMVNDLDYTWSWKAEMYFESQYAIDKHFDTGMLFSYSPPLQQNDSETEAHRAGERYLQVLGFQFNREVQ
jgi:hypothetical protein